VIGYWLTLLKNGLCCKSAALFSSSLTVSLVISVIHRCSAVVTACGQVNHLGM